MPAKKRATAGERALETLEQPAVRQQSNARKPNASQQAPSRTDRSTYLGDRVAPAANQTNTKVRQRQVLSGSGRVGTLDVLLGVGGRRRRLWVSLFCATEAPAAAVRALARSWIVQGSSSADPALRRTQRANPFPSSRISVTVENRPSNLQSPSLFPSFHPASFHCTFLLLRPVLGHPLPTCTSPLPRSTHAHRHTHLSLPHPRVTKPPGKLSPSLSVLLNHVASPPASFFFFLTYLPLPLPLLSFLPQLSAICCSHERAGVFRTCCCGSR